MPQPCSFRQMITLEGACEERRDLHSCAAAGRLVLVA
jgi:hypothetical protein